MPIGKLRCSAMVELRSEVHPEGAETCEESRSKRRPA
jgi:hypothetical protein